MSKLKAFFAIDIFRRHHLLLLLTIGCAAALLMTGSLKIQGLWIIALMFEEKYGLPLWFMFFVGYAEILGALSLFLKRWAIYGSLGLLVILTGASTFHLINDDPLELAGMAYGLTAAMVIIFVYHWADRSAEHDAGHV